jgi:chemotaxis protein CheX
LGHFFNVFLFNGEIVDIAEKIIEATREIFSTMVMMDIAVDDEVAKDSGRLHDTITGLIGLAGTHKVVLAIHIPHPVAIAITSSFLGMEVEGINEDVEDAVGELANMLGGNVKGVLAENGRDIDLSLPSTISGASYQFQSQKDVEKVLIRFKTENGSFLVEMQLEK